MQGPHCAALANVHAPTYTPLPLHPPLGSQAPRTPTALQETALWHPERRAVPRGRPMSAQQMAVVPGPGSQVCECLHTRRRIAQCPGDTTRQLTGL